MKREISFVFIIVSFVFFVLFPKSLSAQDTPGRFSCSCQRDSLGGVNCDVTEKRCTANFTSNKNICSTNPFCKANLNCDVDCIPAGSMQLIGWGEQCNPNNPSQTCSSRDTTCRKDEFNQYRCLFTSNTISMNGTCRDTTECFGFSDIGYNTRCGVPSAGGQSICTPDQLGKMCSDFGGGAACKASCGGNEDPVAGATDCPMGASVCCKPHPGDSIYCGGGSFSLSTAIGCIPLNSINLFIGRIMQFSLGIAGGIAMLLVILGAFQIITSRGDAQKIKSGKEVLTGALIGLIFIFFALFVLRQVGVYILGVIPRGPAPF